MKSQLEAPFQLFLASAFKAAGHRVALTDAGTAEWPTRFSVKGRIKPDLFVRLYPETSLEKFIGIEAKTDGARSISETLDGVQKVIALSTAPLEYVICGDPSKKTFLVSQYYLVTPSSIRDGILCRWEDIWKRKKKWSEDAHELLTLSLTLLLNRYNAAVLMNGMFGINCGAWNAQHEQSDPGGKSYAGSGTQESP